MQVQTRQDVTFRRIRERGKDGRELGSAGPRCGFRSDPHYGKPFHDKTHATEMPFRKGVVKPKATVSVFKRIRGFYRDPSLIPPQI